jgi:hypothetical protein
MLATDPRCAEIGNPDAQKRSDNHKQKIKMKALVSSIALGLSLFGTPAVNTTTDEVTIEYKQTILGARCEIRDPQIGFYAKGNCDKVIDAYERYKAARGTK